MELSPYVEGLRRELGSLTRFAPEDVVRVAGQLAEALDSPVRLTLLDVLSTAAAEITTRLDDTVVEVRLSGGEPEFVVTASAAEQGHPVPAPEAAAEESGTARVTLRLSEQLKARVEAQAAAESMSVNAWLAHAAIRALEGPASGPGSGAARQAPRFGVGQRITGYAKS